MPTTPLAAPRAGPLARGPFAHPYYVIKRPALAFFKHELRVFEPGGALAMYVARPAGLRDAFNVYADASQSAPLLTVKARAVVAVDAIHDIFDSTTGERVGALKARGVRSRWRDTWAVLDGGDREIGAMLEEGPAALRRFFPLLPARWRVEIEGPGAVAHLGETLRLFGAEYRLDLAFGAGRLDPRFGVACALVALTKASRRRR